MSKRLCAALALLAATAASAQTLPAPSGVLGLQSGAELEVARDLLVVNFATTSEGPDAASVQSALRRALDAALAEARRIAKSGQVEVSAGNFNVHPRYDNKGRMSGWTGSVGMAVQGRDMTAIAQLAGRVSSLAISQVSYALSREAREKVEAEVTAQAIARFRERAAEVSRQFGYSGYAIREVQVSGGESAPPPRPYAMRAAKADAAMESLPVEPGTGTVSVTVNGTVQMK